MPWRLIVVIIVFAVLLTFITFNLDNRCDISFGFIQFSGVPVFLTVFVSFIFGLFCALPFALFKRNKHREKPIKEKPIKEVKEKKPPKKILPAGKNSGDGTNDVV
jgi:uncharacterized integral membrane protein